MSKILSAYDDAEMYPDEEPDWHYCPHCGNDMDWADCWMIDCEDGEYDLYEEDCINYGPGTYAKCQECDGNGGWWYCPNKDCKPPPSTSSEGHK